MCLRQRPCELHNSKIVTPNGLQSKYVTQCNLYLYSDTYIFSYLYIYEIDFVLFGAPYEFRLLRLEHRGMARWNTEYSVYLDNELVLRHLRLFP